MIARLARGIAANGFGQIVTVGCQVLSVPLLIQVWGVERYGTWVLLTAIPTALAFADGGLAVAGGNAMTMLIARGQADQAGAIFRAVLRTVVGTCLGLGVVLSLLLGLLPTGNTAFAPLTLVGHHRLALVILTMVVLAGTLATLPAAALRADGRYAFSVTASTVCRLLETMGILVIALFGGGLAAAALAWFAMRLAGAVWLLGWALRRMPWLRSLRSSETSSELGRLRAPALASLAMPTAFAAGLQGVTIAVGAALAPEAVALFSATRTLARASVQVSGLVNHALMPEMARLAGQNDHASMQALTRSNKLSSGFLLGAGWAATLGLGPAIITAWTGGRLHPDSGLLGLMATAALLHGLWLGQANLLLAVNRQGEFAWAFLVSAIAVACLAWPVARAAGLHGVAALTVVGEALMALRLWSLDRRPERCDPVPEYAPS